MKEVGLRWFDRLLGAAFGLVKGALIVAVLVMALAAFGQGSKGFAESLADSRFGSYFLVVGRAATWLAPYELREGFRQGAKAIGTVKDSAPGTSSKPSGAAVSR